jgi:hypothetical protein
MGVSSQLHAPADLLSGLGPGAHFTGNCVGPTEVRMGAENPAHTGIRSLYRPARSEAVYKQRYPVPHAPSPNGISIKSGQLTLKDN